MVKLHNNQEQIANMVFVLAGILTLTFSLPVQTRIFVILSLVSIAVLSNQRGIEIAGVGMCIASFSFAIMYFFGDNPAGNLPVMQGQEKALVAVIYTLILAASVIHLVFQPEHQD